MRAHYDSLTFFSKKSIFNQAAFIVVILISVCVTATASTPKDVNGTFSLSFGKKKEKSNKKSNNATAVNLNASSKLIFAPNKIKAGKSGNCILRLNNPTTDTLRFVLIHDLPDGWSLVNSKPVIIVSPKTTKTVALILVPSSTAKSGLQRISFTFIDVVGGVVIEEEIEIDIDESRQLLIEEMSKIRSIRKGADETQLIYKIRNNGNVDEYITIGKKTQQVYTLSPGDTTIHSSFISIARNSALRNVYNIFKINVLTKNQETYTHEKSLQSVTALRVRGSEITKPPSKFQIPIRSNTSFELRNNGQIQNNYFFTESLSSIYTNKSRNQSTTVDFRYSVNNASIENNERATGEINHLISAKHREVTSSVGSNSSAGYFFLRIPSSMLNGTIEYKDRKYDVLLSHDVQLPKFADNDSTKRVTQATFSKRFNQNVDFSTHQMIFNYANSTTSNNISTLNFKSNKIKYETSLITKSDNSIVFISNQLGFQNDLRYQNSNDEFKVNTFISGSGFNTGSENIRILSYTASKTLNNLRLRISQNSFSQQPLSSVFSNISRNRVHFSSDYTLEKFEARLSAQRLSMESVQALKASQTTVATLNLNTSYFLSNGTAFKLNANVSSRSIIEDLSGRNTASTRLVTMGYSSPTKDKNRYKVNLRWRNIVQQNMLTINGAIDRKLNRSTAINIESDYRFNPEYPNLNTLQVTAGYSFRKNKNLMRADLSFVRRGNGLNSTGANLNLTRQFAISQKDTVAYRTLNAMVVDHSGEPLPEIVIHVNGHTVITDERGEISIKDISKDSVMLILDTKSLPFGVKLIEGNNINVQLLTKQTKVVIQSVTTGEITGLCTLERTGLLKSTQPLYQNYFISLTSANDPEFIKVITQLDAQGNYRIAQLSPGEYKLEIACASTNNNGWKLLQKEATITLQSAEKHVFNLSFTDNVTNFKVQQGLYKR